MWYCSLQHWILLSPPAASTTEHCFCFGPAASFFLDLLLAVLHSSPVADWTPSSLGGSSSSVMSFCLFILFVGSQGKNAGVVRHSLLQWTTFCQNSSLWPMHLGWACMAWLIASLSYTSPFTKQCSDPLRGRSNLAAAKSFTHVRLCETP